MTDTSDKPLTGPPAHVDNPQPLRPLLINTLLNLESFDPRDATMDQKTVDDVLYGIAARGNLEDLEWILQTSPMPNLTSKHTTEPYSHDHVREETALHAAAKNNHLAVVKCLIAAGTPVDCRDDWQQTPLHISAKKGHLNIVYYLVGHAADEKKYVNLGAKYNKTALHHAAHTGNINVAAFLIESGADLLALDDARNSAAMWASEDDKSSGVLAMLLQRDPGQIDKTWDNYQRWTCLHRASMHNAATNIELLLALGANPSLLDIDGRTAWELACTHLTFHAQGAFAFMEMQEKNNHPREHDPQDLNSILAADAEDWNFLPNYTYLWVTALFRRIAKRYEKSQGYQDIQHYLSSAHLSDSFVECLEPGNFLNAREPCCIFEQISDSEPVAKVVSLSIPYFNSETWDNLKQRTKTHKILSSGWKYCCTSNLMAGMAPHLPLTLDEYCKPVLGTTVLGERNKDQVLLWYDRRRRQGMGEQQKPLEQVNKKPPEPPGSARLLTVCQAWLWRVDKLVVVAFCEEKRKGKMGRVELSKKVGLGGHEQTENIGMFLAELVDYFDRPASAGLAEPLLNTFERAIATISDDVNEYIRHPDVEDMDISTETEYYHNIGDIREELSMIKSVLRQQEEVWTTFVSTVWPDHWVDGKFTPPRAEAGRLRDMFLPHQQFRKFNIRIDQLDEDARRVEDSISIRLDLKAKHAGFRQAQNSAKEAHATAVMSAAVFGFTIVTIIFTPMSFMVSVLALPIKKLQEHQIVSRWSTDSGVYRAKYVGKWLAAGGLPSIFLTIIFMWLAVEFGLHNPIMKKSWRWLKSWFKPEKKAEANVTATTPKAGNITKYAMRSDLREASARPDVKIAQLQAKSTDLGKFVTEVPELEDESNPKPLTIDIERLNQFTKHRRSHSYHDLEKGQAPPNSVETVRQKLPAPPEATKPEDAHQNVEMVAPPPRPAESKSNATAPSHSKDEATQEPNIAPKELLDTLERLQAFQRHGPAVEDPD